MTDEQSIQNFVGEQLSAVSFVQDYVELHFDGPLIRCLVRPVVEFVDGVKKQFGSDGYRDDLCGYIGTFLDRAELDVERELRLTFTSGNSLVVPLDDAGREGQPEALHIQFGSGSDGSTLYI